MSSTISELSALFETGLKKDEMEVLAVYRRAKSMGYADIAITIQEGARVKLWLTEKIR